MPENYSNSSEPVTPVSNENVARILALLRAGDEKIGSNKIDNAILVLGKSGSGKTTLINFLARNNEDLISEEIGQDAGEFIIRDKINKIGSGNSTIMSKTVFPELIYDRETKTAYIDCPGFNDRGRNEAYDIATAYFIKKVLGNVKNMKIVLTANYPSLRSGVSRDDFPDLLERVTTLIKNIDRYGDSVALFATKVDNNYTKRKIRGKFELVLVPDKLVIENIATFLSQVQESLKTMRTSDQVLKSNSTLSQNEAFFDKSHKLLDALLQKKGNEYTRLGLFRRPDAAGPVSEIESLQQGKQILKNMLENNLEYAPVDLTRIGYAVSDKSKYIITQLVGEINKSIVSNMAQINDILFDFFKQLENDLFDDSVCVLKEHLEAWNLALARISAVGESAKVDELVSLIEDNITESCKRAAEPTLNEMKKLGKFMDFLQDVYAKNFESFSWKWVGELREAIGYIENSLKWYDFLIALYERLSDYDIQKDVERFHVPKFESKFGRLENYTDFSKFFYEISNSRMLNVQYLKELQKVTIDETKVRYFDQVIESTLRKSVSFSLFNNPGPRLRVSGEYVKISDVIQHSLYPQSKSVQVFATHTVFIDADMTKENDISIIAPRWVIIGSRVINLNGSPAENWLPDKAPECGYSGCNGRNGSPGKPGRSAGHFFGIGDEFENAAQLQIQAIGGVGGMGQHGGDGAKGASGSTHDIVRAKRSLHCFSSQECFTDNSIYSYGDYVEYILWLSIYGSPGEPGGDAGRGGAPGLGGFAGNVTLIGPGNGKPLVWQKVAKGNDGEFGLHGHCGDGGEGGYEVVSKICLNCGSGKDHLNVVYQNNKSPNGNEGVCLYSSSLGNSNLQGRAKPTTVNFLYPPASMISDFRNELVINFNNCVRKAHSVKFYKMLQREDILKYDNVELIFSEFQWLERCCNKFHPNLSETLYKSISMRINNISGQSHHSPNSLREKLFKLLSTALVSKLTRYAKKTHARLVFNHGEYFDVLKTMDGDVIDRYFINRTMMEIKCAGDIVKIVSSDVFHIIEHVIYKISTFDSNDDPEKLKRQLLKLKLFSNFKTITEFLALAISLARVDLDLIKTMRITNIVPSIEISFSVVDGSMINTKLAAIKKTVEKITAAIECAILNEIRSLQSLGDEFDLAVDLLRDVLMNFKSRSSVFNESNQFSMFSSISKEMKTIDEINFAILKNFSPKVNETIAKFENDLKIIQWNVDLFAASTMEKFNRPSLTSLIDSIGEKGVNFDEIAHEVLYLLEPVLVTLRNSLTGDLYKSEDIDKLRAMVSDAIGTIKWKFYQMIAQVEIDEDVETTVQNFDEVLNQLSIIFNESLPDQHRRAIFKNLRSQLKMKQEPNNEHQNYLTKVIDADKLFYEYEHLIDACKTSIFPFDILTNSKLALRVTPHIDESSTQQYQNITASNINQLETELESWEQRIQNVTIAGDFNSGNGNGAFFVWRYDQYKESISKLFRGRAIVLKAQVDAGDKRQMLKFDNIRLHFTSSNSTVQKHLDEDLKYFNASLTHTGNSYFSLCNRVRLVPQDAARFIHNFNETTSRVVDPINGSLKPVLSPFATWIFRLHPVDGNANFNILTPYRKLAVSIELEGNATFVDSLNRRICQKIDSSSPDNRQFSSTSINDDEVRTSSSITRQRYTTTISSGTDVTLTHFDYAQDPEDLAELRSHIHQFLPIVKTDEKVATSVSIIRQPYSTPITSEKAVSSSFPALQFLSGTDAILTHFDYAHDPDEPAELYSDISQFLPLTKTANEKVATSVPIEKAVSSSSSTDQLFSGTEVTSTDFDDVIYYNPHELLESRPIDLNRIRKQRDISSPSGERENRRFKWWNPHNYFSNVESDLRSELPVKTQLLGRNEERTPNFDYSPSLNINGALALIDYVVRNITKIKPHQSMEKSTSVEEARVIALNIIEELENLLSQVPEERRISVSDWQEKDPVEVVSRLEKNIFTGDLSSVKEILFDLVPLDIPDGELDSLLGRHLGSAEIQKSYENSRNVVPDGRSHLSGALSDHAGIPVVDESSNRPILN